MATVVTPGSPQFPAFAGSVPPSSRGAMDEAVGTLRANKDTWVALTIRRRMAILDWLIKDFIAISDRWVAASLEAKGLRPDDPAAGEEWLAGVWPVMRNLRQLRRALGDIERDGRPRIPGPVTTRPDGQVVARVFPQTTYDKLLFMGVSADVWMQPGVTKAELPATQAVIYHDNRHAGKVALVLGAGNVSSIGPMDTVYKLFVEDQVVVYKANPVNAYLGPLMEQAFRALVEPGFLRVTYGGAAEGAYLCNHPEVDEIHITGSDKSFEAIVFGPGPEGAARKARHEPLLTKRVTGELGNVSPVIVVPGPWSASDLAYQADHLATMLTNNAGFNCNATRVIVQHEGWGQRQELLRRLGEVFRRTPPRAAYYPGARERHRMYLERHPEAQQFGEAAGDGLPWTLVAGVDPQAADDPVFTTEAFCSLFAETALPAAGAPEFLDRAVAFCNDQLWGTLNATILVHPRSLADRETAAAVERAVAGLRYGSVAVNYWAAAAYTLGVTTWGGFEGQALHDIQSGNSVVHNTLMFSRAQKSVLRAPFRSVPVPPFFTGRGRAMREVFRRVSYLEASPAPWKLVPIFMAALRR